MSGHPQRLLFIGPTYIGDAAVATAVVATLLDRHPQARITVAVGATAAPLFCNLPRLERLLPVVKRKPFGHWLALWRATVATRWDLVVDLKGSGLAWCLAARRRRVFRPDPSKAHRSQAWAALLDLPDLPRPRLWVGADATAAAAELLVPGTPYLCFAPAGRYRYKLWRPERFVALGRRLVAPGGPCPGARIAVLATADEAAALAPLMAGLPPDSVIDLAGRTDLATAAAVIARAALFVGIDSGLLYVAAAAGVPTLGLLGPTHGLFGPARGSLAAPWAPHVQVVRTPEPVEALASRSRAEREQALSQLDSLSVDAAFAGALSLKARLAGFDGKPA